MESSLWNLLKGALVRDRLGHALLFQYKASEIQLFEEHLRDFIKFCLCEGPKEKNPCGNCESCRILLENTEWVHPDYQLFRTDEATIKVEEVRALHNFFSLRRGLSPRRVVWIPEAERLSLQGGSSGNALLKILEEPRPHTLLLLTSQEPTKLLGTLRSRLHHFNFIYENSVKATDLGEEWKALLNWFEKGASGVLPHTPAREANFWKKREEAIDALSELRVNLWKLFMLKLETGESENSLLRQRLQLRFFEKFELLLQRMAAYAQGPLQWIDFERELAN